MLAGTGCHVLFQLEPVEKGAVIDAAGCTTPDEDGDCFGDIVDVCPGIADPAQADDGDADHVGNACDPNQAIAHRIAHFTGFGDPASAMAEWSTLGTPWTFEEGQAVHADVTAGGELQYATIDDAPEVAVEAGFTFGGWENATTNTPRIGTWNDMPAQIASGHQCVVFPYSDPSGKDTFMFEDSTGNLRAEEVTEIVPGDRVVILADRVRSPDVLRCRLLVNERQVAILTVTAISAWPSSGHVGVRATHVSASLRYVAVYAAP
jgi:hypothetical protein